MQSNRIHVLERSSSRNHQLHGGQRVTAYFLQPSMMFTPAPSLYDTASILLCNSLEWLTNTTRFLTNLKTGSRQPCSTFYVLRYSICKKQSAMLWRPYTLERGISILIIVIFLNSIKIHSLDSLLDLHRNLAFSVRRLAFPHWLNIDALYNGCLCLHLQSRCPNNASLHPLTRSKSPKSRHLNIFLIPVRPIDKKAIAAKEIDETPKIKILL